MTSSWMGSRTALPARYFLHDLITGGTPHNGSRHMCMHVQPPVRVQWAWPPGLPPPGGSEHSGHPEKKSWWENRVGQQLKQGGPLRPGCHPWRACGPGPWTLGCSAFSPRSAPTPTPLPGNSRPFWKLPGGAAEADREIGVWRSPRAQAVSPPLPSPGSGPGDPGSGPPSSQHWGRSSLPLSLCPRPVDIPEGWAGSRVWPGPGMKLTGQNLASRDPEVLPRTAWCSCWRHWSRGAGVQTPGPHSGAPSEKMARPGLLSWPLVRGSERSMGEGGDPWGQIRPVLWSPRALPTAGQGEPTAHKQGAEPGHEPRSHLPA